MNLRHICIGEIIMRYRLVLLLFFLNTHAVQAGIDTVEVPLYRQYFHDKINKEQISTDKADGNPDQQFTIGSNEEVNIHITDALYRKIDLMQDWVEINPALKSNNEKIRYLGYIANTLRLFRLYWEQKELDATTLPRLIDNTELILNAQAQGASIVPFIYDMEYGIARIHAEVFFDNPQIREIQYVVYLKFCAGHPDDILRTIRPFVDAPFADSLIVDASKRNPVQLYSYAQSAASPEGVLIHRNDSPNVQAIAKLSRTPNALFYFPFLDDLFSGKKSVDSIKLLLGDGQSGYDSVGYYKLLVKTEIDYFRRMSSVAKDTPIAMFGANGLREVMKDKAIRHFITPINNLHNENNLNVRMKAIDPLSAEELYYMIVLGENDIYTSSYKHSFNRMMQRIGNKPYGDSLLLRVNFDYFKKFIKMAANYNKLDTFLKTMPAESSEFLMKAFVANLDKTGNLEDATDVADSYSSISNKALLQTILNYIEQNEIQCRAVNNEKGTTIYYLLRNIFLSADSSNHIDLTTIAGIPSIYEISSQALQDDKGRIVQQVFFYGDEDGKHFFPPFLQSFNSRSWKQIPKKEWVEMHALKSKVMVFANRPLDYDANLDDSAQAHLISYLENNDMFPSVVVHRGHSYWLPGTISRMPSNAKIVVLGSCGGYKNLNQILKISPDAHIISTKEIGAGDINRPILDYLNQAMLSGRTIVWKDMWNTLSKQFARDPSKHIRESWDDYIPPYRNLGAIFIKAYNKKMESY
jgi:hypothetical protein